MGSIATHVSVQGGLVVASATVMTKRSRDEDDDLLLSDTAWSSSSSSSSRDPWERWRRAGRRPLPLLSDPLGEAIARGRGSSRRPARATSSMIFIFILIDVNL